MNDKKTRKRALPTDATAWTPEHDLVVFRRAARLVDSVPNHALPRVRAYLTALLAQERLLLPIVVPAPQGTTGIPWTVKP